GGGLRVAKDLRPVVPRGAAVAVRGGAEKAAALLAVPAGRGSRAGRDEPGERVGSLAGGGRPGGHPGGAPDGPGQAQAGGTRGADPGRLGGPHRGRCRAGARHAGRDGPPPAAPGPHGAAERAGSGRAIDRTQQCEGEPVTVDEMDLVRQLKDDAPLRAEAYERAWTTLRAAMAESGPGPVPVPEMTAAPGAAPARRRRFSLADRRRGIGTLGK